MPHSDVYNLRRVIRTLGERGVQLWHNRGRLFFAPREKVDAGDVAVLNACKDEVIRFLKEQQYPIWGALSEVIAPAPVAKGGYAGVLPRKPWDYEVAIILPTFGRLDLVEAAIYLWKQQTVSPYFLVIQTGPAVDRDRHIEELRDVDCEVHEIACHGWRHSSSPVSAALDLGFAVCQTDRALLTHTDVFPKHDRVIEELLTRISPSCPVVGYQVSKRVGSAEWTSCVSHTLTMLDMVAMRRIGARWNLLSVLEEDGEVEQRFMHWPDTETRFGRSLRAAGVVPEFLGSESNAPVYENDFIVHWRSAPSVRHYLPHQSDLRHPGLAEWLERSLALGRAAELPELPESLTSEHADHGATVGPDDPPKHCQESADRGRSDQQRN